MRVYLDNASTTKADAEVINEIALCMNDVYANPSSLHSMGQHAAAKVEAVREICAKAIQCMPNEIHFTSGGTESNNLALLGYARANIHKGKHIITSSVEHHAVLNPCKQLEQEGYDVTYLSVDEEGLINIEELSNSIREDTILLSIMHVNNEIGTIQPIEQIGAIAQEKGIAFHCDAVQSFGKLIIDVNRMNIDMLSMSAHKLHGPKGVGFLYVRKGFKIDPIVYGGDQEKKIRPGTINAPLIAGMGIAIQKAYQDMHEREENIGFLRNYLLNKIKNDIDGVVINGSMKHRISENLNVSISGIETDALLYAMDLEGICISAGSACMSGSVEPSHVIKAIGKANEGASVRFTLSKYTTVEELELAFTALKSVVKRLRG